MTNCSGFDGPLSFRGGSGPKNLERTESEQAMLNQDMLLPFCHCYPDLPKPLIEEYI